MSLKTILLILNNFRYLVFLLIIIISAIVIPFLRLIPNNYHLVLTQLLVIAAPNTPLFSLTARYINANTTGEDGILKPIIVNNSFNIFNIYIFNIYRILYI